MLMGRTMNASSYTVAVAFTRRWLPGGLDQSVGAGCIVPGVIFFRSARRTPHTFVKDVDETVNRVNTVVMRPART